MTLSEANKLIKKMGRPSKYEPNICDKMIKYFMRPKTQRQVIATVKRFNKDGVKIHDEEKFKIVPNDMPTFSEFAMQIGVDQTTLERWYNAVEDENAEEPIKKYPDFCRAYNVAKSLQKAFLVDNGMQGNSPPATTIFVLKNVTDMTDKQIIETKDSDYKEKQDALSEWFDTIRHHITPGPADTGTDQATS